MDNLNRDPHEHGYVFIPLNRITSIFAAAEDVAAAVKDLRRVGFAAQDLDIFVGAAGAATLDLLGECHGPVIRQLRNFEALMVQDAGETRQQGDAALKGGGLALGVLMDGKEPMTEAVAAL